MAQKGESLSPRQGPRAGPQGRRCGTAAGQGRTPQPHDGVVGAASGMPHGCTQKPPSSDPHGHGDLERRQELDAEVMRFHSGKAFILHHGLTAGSLGRESRVLLAEAVAWHLLVHTLPAPHKDPTPAPGSHPFMTSRRVGDAICGREVTGSLFRDSSLCSRFTPSGQPRAVG